MEEMKEVITPDQVAEYLQLNRDTVYRYIREGKLAASRLGRDYRITKANVGIFLLSTITRAAVRESVAERNKEMPFEEVENDIAEMSQRHG